MRTIHYLYISIASFICFFFLTIFIINGNQIFFDEPFYFFLTKFQMTPFYIFITHLGSALFLLIAVLFLFFAFKNKSNWKFLLSMMLLEIGANYLLKQFFGRPRPSFVHLVSEDGYSFPSGHMMASTMFYGLCIYFIWNTKLPKSTKFLFSFLLSVLIVLIGISRIYLGVHYASDILGGFSFSLFMLCFGIFFYQSMGSKYCKITVKE